MHRNSTAASTTSADLVLTDYGAGFAWLERSTEPSPQDNQPRYWITWEGRRQLRLAELYGCVPDDA
jgi:hypothetical protein